MTQNVEKVHRHVPILIDGVSHDTKCRKKVDRDVPAQIDGVSYDTKCTECR